MCGILTNLERIKDIFLMNMSFNEHPRHAFSLSLKKMLLSAKLPISFLNLPHSAGAQLSHNFGFLSKVLLRSFTSSGLLTLS